MRKPTETCDYKITQSACTLELLFDNLVSCTVIGLDATGRITNWNAAALRLFGYTAQEIVGQPASCLLAEASAMAPQLAAALQTGRHVSNAWRLRKDGTRFWSNTIVEAAADPNGQTHHFIMLVRDLTQGINVSDLLHSVLDHDMDGIICIDEAGLVKIFNRGAERIFGYSRDEMIGHSINRLMPPPICCQHDGHLQRYLQTGDKRIIGTIRELEAQRKNGSRFPAELEVSEFVLEGRPHFSGIIRDITQRKLLEKQLRLSRKLEVIGKLAGGMAHDFNNSLTVIAGYSEILLKHLPPTDLKTGFVREIRQAAERASGLTRQLLAFGRRQSSHPRAFSVNDVVTGIEAMLRQFVGETIRVTTRLEPAIHPVLADPSQLEQALLNLVINARDAMPKGGSVTIESHSFTLDEAWSSRQPGSKPGPHVLLAVSDTGLGMTPEVKSHLFEPFFTTKEPGKGTGLGLAMVYEMIKQNHGFVEVESEAGQGAAFKLYFPAAADAPQRETKFPPAVATPRGTETVLLVEDDPGVRLIASMVLEAAGYHVKQAGSGVEASRLAELHPGPIHLLVTDVVMPGVSGPELADHLRRLQAGIKVLYISGHADEVLLRHGLKPADAALLQKPFMSGTLLSRVREILDAKPTSTDQ